jgi:hypothetical protein
MTFEQVRSALVSIRRQQGTNSPLVRVDFGGAVYRGRVRQSDTDSDRRSDTQSPFGVLVLEPPGLHRTPETILQIASIPENGLQSIDE